MSVRRTPKGRYYYRFQRDHRGYCKGGFLTWEQARNAETTALSQAIQGMGPLDRSADRMTFAEAGKVFLERSDKHSGHYRRNDHGQIKRIACFCGSRLLKDIGPEDVEACLLHLQRRQAFGDHTRNHYLTTTRLVFNRLKKWRMFSGENPANFVEMRKVPRVRVRSLSPTEERVLTPAIAKDSLVWPYYVVALHTGMRIGEVAGMRVKDIDLLTGQIFVPHSKNHRSRHVPMSESLMAFLRQRTERKRSDDRVLPVATTGYISRRFRWLGMHSGILDLRFHDLRHTFAARLLTQDVPIYKVSKILGHSSVVVTEQHYGHLSPSDLMGAIRAINCVIGEPFVTQLQQPLVVQAGLQAICGANV